MEVLYSINGQYFRDFGIFISESKGLADKPKPKARRSYDWAEYHGKAIDTAPTKYDEREIVLSGWIEGESWDAMFNQFDNFLKEFEKDGLSRLLIEYGKELVYDVYLDGATELKKEFKQGHTVGTFSIKLKEPHPVKRTFKLVGHQLQLSFSSSSWVEVTTEQGTESTKGVFAVNTTLPSRQVSKFDFGGRNLYKGTKDFSGSQWMYRSHYVEENDDDFKVLKKTPPWAGLHQSLNGIKDEIYTLSLWVKKENNSKLYSVYLQNATAISNNQQQVNSGSINTWVKSVVTFKINNDGIFQIRPEGYNHNSFIYFKQFKFERGNQSTDWTPAPEDVHFITLAGNLEDITNLQTNAEEITLM